MKKLWKKNRNICILMLFLSTITILTLKVEIVKSAVIESVNLFMTTLFPTLFPFFVLANCAIALKIPMMLGKIFNPIIEKWLHLEREAAFIIIMSIFTGFLAGTKYTEDMYQKGYITTVTANRLLMCTHFGNPAFVIMFIGTVVLKNIQLGILLFLIQIFCNLFLARLTRPKEKPVHNIKIVFQEKSNNILGNAIFDSFQTLLMMLGSMTLFLIIENIIISLFSSSSFIQVIIKMASEITSGLTALSSISISVKLKLILTTIGLSLGGANIHLQTASYLEKSKLKYKYFLKGRIYATLLQTILVFLLCSII